MIGSLAIAGIVLMVLYFYWVPTGPDEHLEEEEYTPPARHDASTMESPHSIKKEAERHPSYLYLDGKVTVDNKEIYRLLTPRLGPDYLTISKLDGIQMQRPGPHFRFSPITYDFILSSSRSDLSKGITKNYTRLRNTSLGVCEDYYGQEGTNTYRVHSLDYMILFRDQSLSFEISGKSDKEPDEWFERTPNKRSFHVSFSVALEDIPKLCQIHENGVYLKRKLELDTDEEFEEFLNQKNI